MIGSFFIIQNDNIYIHGILLIFTIFRETFFLFSFFLCRIFGM